MPGSRPCPVCNHDSRLAIEQAILSGKALRAIAVNFGFTYQSRSGKTAGTTQPSHKVLVTHRDKHMADAYQRAMAEREEESGVAMAARLRMLDEEVDRVIRRANEGHPVIVGEVPLLNADGSPILRYDSRLLLAAIREGRQNLDLMARLAGKVENDPEGLDKIRAYLESPAARRLLAELDRLAMAEETG